jgi:restriction endonuclease S subunit
MAKITIVDYKVIQDMDILSSNFYKKEILNTIQVINRYIKKYGYFYLSDKTFIKKVETRTFHTYSSAYYTDEKHGYPLIQVSTLRDFFLSFNIYISKAFEDKYKGKYLFPPTSIFISRGGTIGLVGINYEKVCSISQDVIGILPNEEKIKAEVLFAFFLSKYGQAILQTCIMGAVQPHLELTKLKRKMIPLFPEDIQKKVAMNVREAYQKRNLADKKYKQAEKKLYELLGIDREEIEKLKVEKAYETTFNEVKQAFRFDAEYYHPKYLRIVDFLKKTPFKIKKLKEVVKISNEKIDPTKEPYKTMRFKYVPIAKINESGEIYEWEEFYGWQAPSRARMLIRKGDILVPSLIGTFDKIALVPEELDNQLATTGCFVVRAYSGYPEFFFLLFRTPLFKRQLERYTTGAIMSAVPRKVFENILIPDVPEEAQTEIAQLVRDYFKLRKESRMLIQKAVRIVEEVIESESADSSKG